MLAGDSNMINLLTWSLGVLAVSATGSRFPPSAITPQAQQGGARPDRPITTTTTIMDNSESVRANLFESSGKTYTAECYDGPNF